MLTLFSDAYKQYQGGGGWEDELIAKQSWKIKSYSCN